MRLPSRPIIVGLIVSLVFLILCILSRVLGFAHIFLADSRSGIRLTQQEALEAHRNVTNDKRPQLIPKIIHQVFHNWHDPGNETLPGDWARVRQTCVDRNPGWEVTLWTERTSRDFIAREYTWFLNTYDSYRFKVQRVDAVRYFLLLHYGGIYLDLDNGCSENLEPLLYYPMWITEPGRGALSNNVLASRPHHPYWSHLTHALMAYNYNYLFPYVTISYASGQWFVTSIWEAYHKLLPDLAKSGGYDGRLHRLMMDDRAGADPSIFFTQERGGTWKNWDNRMFLWIGDHLILLLVVVTVGLGGMAWLALRYLRRHGYTRLRMKPV